MVVTFAPAATTLSSVRISPRAFHHGDSATISFRLSRAARVTLRFARLVLGRRHGKRCVAAGKHGLRCTAVELEGKFSVAGKKGRNRVAFRGKLNSQRLPAGHYRLTVSLGKGPSGSVPFTLRK